MRFDEEIKDLNQIEWNIKAFWLVRKPQSMSWIWIEILNFEIALLLWNAIIKLHYYCEMLSSKIKLIATSAILINSSAKSINICSLLINTSANFNNIR